MLKNSADAGGGGCIPPAPLCIRPCNRRSDVALTDISGITTYGLTA